ncbi:MAG: ATP-binding cassette domain-containing protein [Anaerolineae bacterium]|nr:ATP-binding cassette domain-containing protein [Anaerolineae bacterium]
MLTIGHLWFKVPVCINPDKVVGYLGPNGSGKTTSIRMLLGLLNPSDSLATVLGYDADPKSEEVRAITDPKMT